jgi:hypothetical protein
MAAFFVVLSVLLMAFLYAAGEALIYINFPDFYRRFNPGETVELAVLFALTALWLLLIGLSLAGSTWPVPLLKRFAHSPWVVRFSLVGNSLALALMAFTTVLAFHATSLTRTSREDSMVYFLYDEGIPVPRWGYALGLYRVTLQAQRNWGKGSTVLDRLNRENLRAALAHGKVVILATHGGDGYACTYYAAEKLGVGPPDTGATNERQSSRFLRISVLDADNKFHEWENVDVNSELRLVYLFGCDAGKKASQWEEHLAPAQVVSYNRMSTIFDHGLWFGFTAPAQMKKLR